LCLRYVVKVGDSLYFKGWKDDYSPLFILEDSPGFDSEVLVFEKRYEARKVALKVGGIVTVYVSNIHEHLVYKWFCIPACGEDYTLAVENFETKEEAIKRGIEVMTDVKNGITKDYLSVFGKEYDETVNLESFVYIQCGIYIPKPLTRQLVENMRDDALSKVGNMADDYLKDVKAEHLVELDKVILDWMNFYGYVSNSAALTAISEESLSDKESK
jgi:hypothetical protein